MRGSVFKKHSGGPKSSANYAVEIPHLLENSAECLEKGFILAHFICPRRTIALEILIGALNKLRATRHQEEKRAYWRDKFLKNRITRITRDNRDALQWLIYLESEPHEKAEEASGLPSDQEMVVRYVKTLIRLSSGMSSFYVNLAIHRILHRYSTSETQRIYEFVSDHYREGDEYRRAKRLLIRRLESRFWEAIQIKEDQGEVRFELAEDQGVWQTLVEECLQMFTPWSTQEKCPCRNLGCIDPRDVQEAFKGNCEETDNQDKIETSLCHVFIDPVCSHYIVRALGLQEHSSKLGVPRFYMDADRNRRPPSPRLPDGPLTSRERQVIAETLAAEAERRRNVSPRELRFMVDGADCAHLRLHEKCDLQFRVPCGSRLLEIWTEDNVGSLLLATYLMASDDTMDQVEKSFTMPLGDRNALSISVVSEPESEMNSWTISVQQKRHGSLKASQAWRQFPRGRVRLAFGTIIAVLLVAIPFLWFGLMRQLNTERLQKNALKAELAQERTARTSPPSGMAMAYRLTPDDLITRGSSEKQEQSIVLPRATIIISLELPVRNTRGSYQATLLSLTSTRTIMTEDMLSPIFLGSDPIVVFSVPSDMLHSSRYYRVELMDKASHYVRTFMFNTALNDR